MVQRARVPAAIWWRVSPYSVGLGDEERDTEHEAGDVGAQGADETHRVRVASEAGKTMPAASRRRLMVAATMVSNTHLAG